MQIANSPQCLLFCVGVGAVSREDLRAATDWSEQMKRQQSRTATIFRWALLLYLLLLPALPALADTHYVNVMSTNQIPPYTNWVDAATNIQDAINQTVDGDEVLVTNGTYVLTNQITVANGITVKGVNGATNTIIDANYPTNTSRCFYLSHSNAVIIGFTIRNGHEDGSLPWFGGGVLGIESPAGPTIRNCVITNNYGSERGGGVYGCIAYNCIITDNQGADNGGAGASHCILYDCVLRANLAYEMGGGAAYSTLYNCLVVSNRFDSESNVPQGAGVLHCTLYNCVITGNEGFSINDAVSAASDSVLYNCLVVDNTAGLYDYILSASTLYNCTVVGNSVGIDGATLYASTAYNSIVYYNTGGFTNFSASTLSYCNTYPDPGGIGNITNAPMFVASNDYHLASSSPCIDTGTNLAEIIRDIEGVPRPLDGNGDGISKHDMGAYEYAIPSTNTHYVSLVGTPHSPYTNWIDAARVIQDAINETVDGDLVLVADGVYILSAQIEITNGVTVQSVNGVSKTIVDGNYPLSTNRCFYLSHSNALVDGFTITRGSAMNSGGIYCYSGTVQNCVITCNLAFGEFCQGGGVYLYGGIIRNCVITSNNASGEDSQGGGVYCSDGAVVQNCVITDNRASGEGWGGGMYYGSAVTVENCTITRNFAGDRCGGVRSANFSMTRNCIIYFNTGWEGNNNAGGGGSYRYCCMPGPESSEGAVTNDPQLTGTYRLKSTSPCIDAGTNIATLATDIDGEARWDHPGHADVISIYDIGADEFVDVDLDDMADHWEIQTTGTTNINPAANEDTDTLDNLAEYNAGTDPTDSDTDDDLMPDGWEVGYSLDPLVDDASLDPDADSMISAGEYIADTDPTNAASVLSITSITGALGVITIDWKGGSLARQILEYRQDLLSTNEWIAILTNEPPTATSTNVIDLGATNSTLFYRIKAIRP